MSTMNNHPAVKFLTLVITVLVLVLIAVGILWAIIFFVQSIDSMI